MAYYVINFSTKIPDGLFRPLQEALKNIEHIYLHMFMPGLSVYCINNTAPSYLTDLLSFYTTGRALTSAGQMLLTLA